MILQKQNTFWLPLPKKWWRDWVKMFCFMLLFCRYGWAEICFINYNGDRWISKSFTTVELQESTVLSRCACMENFPNGRNVMLWKPVNVNTEPELKRYFVLSWRIKWIQKRWIINQNRYYPWAQSNESDPPSNQYLYHQVMTILRALTGIKELRQTMFWGTGILPAWRTDKAMTFHLKSQIMQNIWKLTVQDVDR